MNCLVLISRAELGAGAGSRAGSSSQLTGELTVRARADTQRAHNGRWWRCAGGNGLSKDMTAKQRGKRTQGNGWTPQMVVALAGILVPGVVTVLVTLITKGADVILALLG